MCGRWFHLVRSLWLAKMPMTQFFQVRWSDKKDGYGEHYWEYNHAPKSYKDSDEESDYRPEPDYKPEPNYKPEPVYKPAKAPVYHPSYNS